MIADIGVFSRCVWQLTRGFVHAPDNFAHQLAGTAFLLEGTRPAIGNPRTIYSCIRFGDTAPLSPEVTPILQKLLAGRACHGVGRRVEDEVRTAEGSVIAFAHLLQGHMRLDGFLFHHPRHHFGRAVGGIADRSRDDPELMIRMLLIGYCYGVRSERRLSEEVDLNLAYCWFCRLNLDDAVPEHPVWL